jgi:hypothetical protein
VTSFHTLEDWDRAFEIITGEDDPFRLVIRGYALIDERLHKVIRRGFP